MTAAKAKRKELPIMMTRPAELATTESVGETAEDVEFAKGRLVVRVRKVPVGSAVASVVMDAGAVGVLVSAAVSGVVAGVAGGGGTGASLGTP